MSERDPIGQDERRIGERVPLHAPTRLEFKGDTIAGRTENLSSSGVLLSSNDPVRVLIEIEGRPREGRVVRCHRLQDGTVGWAIQFDEPLD